MTADTYRVFCVMLQVGLSEAQLQPAILEICKTWLGHSITCDESWPTDLEPIIIGNIGQHTVLLVNVKTNKGGNASAELLVRKSCINLPAT